MKRVLRPIFYRIAVSLGIPGIHNRLDELERHVSPSGLKSDMFSAMERRITDLAMAQMPPMREELSRLRTVREELATHVLHVENRLRSLNEALVSHVDAKQQQNKDSIDDFVRLQSAVISDLRQSIDTIRRLANGTSQKTRSQSQSVDNNPTSTPSSVIDDALYVALENHFRGSRDLVAQRQRDYLPMLPELINASTPLVDLGCGRGEWLKVVRDHGLPAIGVDSNTVCIAECREENLDVIQEDLLEFLSVRPSASVGAYTLFQVLEHLPFSVLVTTLREIRRTLVPGGRLIAEVPNAKNLRVSAGTFWIDPTHQRPLYPELLMFLASEVGFTRAEGHYANNLSPEYDLSGLPDNAKNALKSVVDAVDGPGDFALIATA
jgi:O-antigen chain-terminating methyltransferase